MGLRDAVLTPQAIYFDRIVCREWGSLMYVTKEMEPFGLCRVVQSYCFQCLYGILH